MYWHVFVSLVMGSVLGIIVHVFGRHRLPGFFNYHGGCHPTFKEASRPRHLASELDTNKLLYIGVMTARKYLDTRTKAVYNTWGKDVPGKLEFFVSNDEKLAESELPITTLAGIRDNEYPPQKKVMTMLRYMYDNYIDDYEWFMRADDDVYVRTQKLQTFLRSLNSSSDTVVGQGGIGKSAELNKLGLLKGECYCMGGPGVIMSKNVLRKVAPNIEECLKDVASTHEDVELGRCIRKFAGVSCLWAQETTDLFQQVYNDQEKAYHGTLDVGKIRKAITLHPVKESAYMFRLHSYFLSLKLQRLHYNTYINIANLKRTKKARKVSKTKGKKMVVRPRNADFYHQANTASKLQWEFLTTKRIFDLKSQHSRSFSTRMMKGLNNALGKTMQDLDRYYSNILGRKKKNRIQFKEIDCGYLRINPKHGVQFLFSLYIKGPEVGRRNFPWTPPKPTYHLTSVQHAFSNLQATIKERSQNEKETVHLIVPLMGKLEEFERFLENIRQAFLIPGEKIKVLVVYFSEKSSPKNHTKILEKYKTDFPGTEFMWEDIDGDFNRAKALQRGAEYFSNDSLLFFSDVDLVFKKDFLYRCRHNTIQGKQVYFPVMFGQYNRDIAYFGKPKPKSNFIYTETAGLWRIYSFGPVSIYASDVITVGGLDTTIKGWGMEDLDFADKVIESGLSFFRTPDPGIVHVYHSHVPCNANLSQRQWEMCQRSTNSTYAPASGLVSFMMSKKYIE